MGNVGVNGLLAAAGGPETIPMWQWWVMGGAEMLALAALFGFSYFSRAGIIARATMKEAVRQPVFLLLMAIGVIVLLANTWVPFFSLGEDIKMLKDCGLATILISGMLLAIWTASTAIADEIEGKTAMTLLSKLITRRQFIIGKYIGIMQAVVLLMIVLSVLFLALIYYKVGYDARESSRPIPPAFEWVSFSFLPFEIPLLVWGERAWHAFQVAPGLHLILLEVAVLTALSVAISTRLPMVVNMVSCFAIFVVGHLTPVLVKSDAITLEFVEFMARLIATVLPNLEDAFNMQTAIAVDRLVPPAFLGVAAVYCIVYSAAAILLSFILFEDRDLA